LAARYAACLCAAEQYSLDRPPPCGRSGTGIGVPHQLQRPSTRVAWSVVMRSGVARPGGPGSLARSGDHPSALRPPRPPAAATATTSDPMQRRNRPGGRLVDIAGSRFDGCLCQLSFGSPHRGDDFAGRRHGSMHDRLGQGPCLRIIPDPPGAVHRIEIPLRRVDHEVVPGVRVQR
jgi:hypothetical protein